MRHQKIDVLFVKNIGSSQSVGLFVSKFNEHSAFDRFGRLRAAVADASDSIVPDANSFLVSFEERATEDRGPNRNIIFGLSALGVPHQSPILDESDFNFDVLEGVSFNFNLKQNAVSAADAQMKINASTCCWLFAAGGMYISGILTKGIWILVMSSS
jgi:hypothetical protein